MNRVTRLPCVSALCVVAGTLVSVVPHAFTAETTEVPSASASGDPIRLIDSYVRMGWDQQGLRPAVEATPGEWCRRVYLDVIGRIPKVQELESFLRLRDADKKQQLVDRLLGDEYREEYARHWSTIWTNLLIGRTGGLERRSLTSRPGMQAWLHDAFIYNKPYDTLAYELITARGSTRPGEEDFNGATNFLAGKLEDNGVQATARTSQVFLGVQVQCTQCHNHPFNEYKQNQFWELNAFFRQTVALRSFTGRDISNVRLDDQDYAGEGGDPLSADLYYEMRNGRVGQAFPTFIDGTALATLYAERNAADFIDEQGNLRRGEAFGNSGYLAHIQRREELAKLVTASEYFEQAAVNRMWARFFGYGFTKPIDDLGPHNAPSHPDLLVELAAHFRETGFDLKQLIRWIALSEPYVLSSRMTRQQETLDNPEIGTRPWFSHFYLRQIEAEQLYESLLTATAADATVASDAQESAKQRWLGQFGQAFGTDEGDESTTFNGSIPQVLMMMNGELIRRACGTDSGSFLYRVATDGDLSSRQKIDHLYLAALSRRPAGDEIAAANQVLSLRRGNTAAALQDIWWALLNSNEFILNH